MTGEEFDAIVAPIRNLIAKKGEDYNHAVKLQEYFPFGQKSYVQMCYMKAMRMRSLVQQNTTPNFDSMKDTVQDEIAYAVFFLAFLEAEEQRAKVQTQVTSATLPVASPRTYTTIQEVYQQAQT